jgi:hypothetical protein
LYTLGRRLDGPHSRSRCCVKKKISFSCRESSPDPSVVQNVTSTLCQLRYLGLRHSVLLDVVLIVLLVYDNGELLSLSAVNNKLCTQFTSRDIEKIYYEKHKMALRGECYSVVKQLVWLSGVLIQTVN